MQNFPPHTTRPVRRFAVALLAMGWMTSGIAAPELAGPATSDSSLDTVGARLPVDPVIRLLADTGLIASPSSPAVAHAALAESTEDRFVDRMRDKASDMVLTAMNFLGVPYRRGGQNAERGFDCSGFTRHIFEMSLGLVLPRRADEQATTAGLLRVGRAELKPGDLVFFNTLRRTFSHVGIYVGEGKFIHSPKPGGEVRVDDMHAAYWEKRFTGGRRAEPTPAAPSLMNVRAVN